MSKAKKMEKLLEDLKSGKKVEVKKEVKKVEKKEEVKFDADLNNDGVVDEEDLSIVHKEYEAEKKKKKKKD